jgi:CubicO group peptidase (beta-lactamase class C family)
MVLDAEKPMSHESVIRDIADPMFRQLCREVVATMERLHVPGVAVGLIDGDAEHVAGFGVTNIHHPLPIDADTLFQIGSQSGTCSTIPAAGSATISTIWGTATTPWRRS